MARSSDRLYHDRANRLIEAALRRADAGHGFRVGTGQAHKGAQGIGYLNHAVLVALGIGLDDEAAQQMGCLQALHEDKGGHLAGVFVREED